MTVKQKRPLTNGQRFQIVDTFDDLTKFTPERSLLSPIKKTGGRDWRGFVSARCRGGGSRRKYRAIDFKRDKDGILAEVLGIEYDPNRNARIVLLKYEDSELRYILAPLGITVGEKLMSGPEAEIKPGNCLSLQDIPLGTALHAVELHPGRGAQLGRSAGTAIILAAKDRGYAILKLPSGEQRKVLISCRATVGQVGNPDAKNVSWGKAGSSRHRGWRPKVRGSAMNPCDHPHGGGEGKAGAGRKHPLTPTGRPALGKLTRNNKRTNKYILTKRPTRQSGRRI